ncbi:MAG TPA: hypothetical protein VNG95_01695 [Gemmatimonadales bacterium]|nr:hypothetical protein [Gemmatimonadales bacterium]
MSATATPTTFDQTDLPHLLTSGAKLGALTAGFVILFLVAARYLPAGAAAAAESVIVLGIGLTMAVLPARWTVARHTEGIAGAAGVGLFSTVVFMAIDILVLRPVKAYPWTWDAIGGNSTWWYLAVWWQLGTFVSWMGAMFTAGQNARREMSTSRLAMQLIVPAVVLGFAAQYFGPKFTQPFPVAFGFGFAVTVVVLAIDAIVRKA